MFQNGAYRPSVYKSWVVPPTSPTLTPNGLTWINVSLADISQFFLSVCVFFLGFWMDWLRLHCHEQFWRGGFSPTIWREIFCHHQPYLPQYRKGWGSGYEAVPHGSTPLRPVPFWHPPWRLRLQSDKHFASKVRNFLSSPTLPTAISERLRQWIRGCSAWQYTVTPSAFLASAMTTTTTVR